MIYNNKLLLFIILQTRTEPSQGRARLGAAWGQILAQVRAGVGNRRDWPPSKRRGKPPLVAHRLLNFPK